MIRAAVPTNFRKSLRAQQTDSRAHCVYTNARYLKEKGGFVAFEGLREVRSEGGGPMKGISHTIMIPFPPIASGISSVRQERDVVIPNMRFQRVLNMVTKTSPFFITPAPSTVSTARTIITNNKPLYHPGFRQKSWPEPWTRKPPASVILVVIPRRRFYTPLRRPSSP